MLHTALSRLLDQEKVRQESTIDLIASENYASEAILNIGSSALTNKYAEGYPGKRYYGGCEIADEVEDLARELGKELFSAEHVNVQPHSGSQANMAIYHGFLEPGDTILGMSLSAGGHLTHGHKINFSGKLYNIVSYGVDKASGCIDYQEVRHLALEHKPKLIIAGASAYSRSIDFAVFRTIADECGALLLVDMAHIAGLVATGLHQNPVLYADFVTSTTHKTLRGPRGGLILCKKEHGAKVDKAVMPGIQGGPLMHVIAAKAQCFFEALTPEFKTYQAQIIKNTRAMAEEFKTRGFTLVSNGTDNHLFLVDLISSPALTSLSEEMTGARAEELLLTCNIVLNRNCVPFDTKSPFVTSGIRIGTPAITTRGMLEEDAQEIASLICLALENADNKEKVFEIKARVSELCALFPVSNDVSRVNLSPTVKETVSTK